MKVIEKIQIGSGEHFIAINENSNTLYVSNKWSNSIEIIDCSSYEITNRIKIESPRQIVVNSTKNILFVINGNTGIKLGGNGAKISIIDTFTNKIIDTIGEKEGFGDITLNKETNVFYVTQPKSKNVWIIDGCTYNIIDKIETGGKYYALTVDSKTNRLFLGGTSIPFFKIALIQIDLSNNKISKITSKFDLGTPRLENFFFSTANNKLFFNTVLSSEQSESKVEQINLNSNSFGNNECRVGDMDRACFDSTTNKIYFTNVSDGKIQILDHTLKEIDSFTYEKEPYGLREMLKRKYGTAKICINSKTGTLYLSEERSNLLYVIKE